MNMNHFKSATNKYLTVINYGWIHRTVYRTATVIATALQCKKKQIVTWFVNDDA